MALMRHFIVIVSLFILLSGLGQAQVFTHGFNHRQVALTFDDGPSPVWTPKILDELKSSGIKATFFMLGEHAEKYPDVARRVASEGHEIGNHTFTHQDMSKVSRQWAGLEMDATRLLIECITGHSTILFRAPFNAD